METFTILTTEPNAVAKPIHNRMPVILPHSEYQRWLGPDPDPTDLLKPYDPKVMVAYPVSTLVNKPAKSGGKADPAG